MTVDLIEKFHEKFGHTVANEPNITDQELNAFRVMLLESEVNELIGALQEQDPAHVLQELCDIQYVLDGAFLSLGMAKYRELAMHEVHRANMSKVDDDGNPMYRDDGKVMKGPNYRKPDMQGVINAIDLWEGIHNG